MAGNRLTDLLALSHVPRWSIVPHYRPQSVADHTFRVMVIFIELAERVGIAINAANLIDVLWHDVDESRTGDLPSLAKSQFGLKLEGCPCPWKYGPSTLDGDLRLVYKLADDIEGATFIHMHGAGPHATRALEGLERKIFDECPSEWRSVVADIMRCIELEEGR